MWYDELDQRAPCREEQGLCDIRKLNSSPLLLHVCSESARSVCKITVSEPALKIFEIQTNCSWLYKISAWLGKKGCLKTAHFQTDILTAWPEASMFPKPLEKAQPLLTWACQQVWHNWCMTSPYCKYIYIFFFLNYSKCCFGQKHVTDSFIYLGIDVIVMHFWFPAWMFQSFQ